LESAFGLDAGEALPLEGGYRGEALNVASRLCAAAGARQILTTETVARLATRLEGVRVLPPAPCGSRASIDRSSCKRLCPSRKVPAKKALQHSGDVGHGGRPWLRSHLSAEPWPPFSLFTARTTRPPPQTIPRQGVRLVGSPGSFGGGTESEAGALRTLGSKRATGARLPPVGAPASFASYPSNSCQTLPGS